MGKEPPGTYCVKSEVQNDYHGSPIRYYNQSGVTELLIIRDFHSGGMCFKPVETIGALHS